ncbi:hypothetical protein [Hyphomicrobium sp. D-2]|uniref:hypothetical protein n=1 Tax=Hyphomicrobium sp. D-2 TaxID=3041621 RepID=UPI002453EB89|nr:hypothetical protein [Hyphomicrobium sp. D-2]MDH4982076.1 hypothetical protein [Hyphomicrobium sp. D-2]
MLFIHEDDWGQIEVLPASCAEWCNREIARIAEQAERSALPMGAGWSELAVRDPAPEQLSNLKIVVTDVAATFSELLPQLDGVATGTFSSAQRVPRLMAFGFGQGAAIIITPDRSSQYVDALTLSLDTSEHEARYRILAAIAALSPASALMLVDWLQGCSLLLSDQTAIDDYISGR